MELQEHEGGRTREQNETHCILTFSNCMTSFSARCLNCQLALPISARRTVKESSFQVTTPQEFGNPHPPGNKVSAITQQHNTPHCEVLQQTFYKQQAKSDIEEVHSSCSFRQEAPPQASASKSHDTDAIKRKCQTLLSLV